jgi:hypothetical protein
LPPLLPGLPLMKLIATKMEFVLTNRFSNWNKIQLPH